MIFSALKRLYLKRHSCTLPHTRVAENEGPIVLSLIVALVLRLMSSWLRKYCISARINLVELRFNFKIEKVPAELREKNKGRRVCDV